jgi:hypothetical protein
MENFEIRIESIAEQYSFAEAHSLRIISLAITRITRPPSPISRSKSRDRIKNQPRQSMAMTRAASRMQTSAHYAHTLLFPASRTAPPRTGYQRHADTTIPPRQASIDKARQSQPASDVATILRVICHCRQHQYHD